MKKQDKETLQKKINKIEKQIKQKKDDIKMFSDAKNYPNQSSLDNLIFFLRIELKFLENKYAKLQAKLFEIELNEVNEK